MKFDPKIHHRHSIRLQGYDYSQSGAYYVTIVAHGRECLFGEINNGEMRLNRFGQIVQQAWFDLPNHYPHIELGAFCIMPNHVHAVIIIIGAGLRPAPTEPAPTVRHPLSEIVRAFKSFSAKRINALRKTQGIPVWQRNYYERIIRNDEEHNRIHLYIEANIDNWAMDDENPVKSK
ncbi:MAG: transposase [Chloroflexi bacterium]|nr:transposase [Chloroflexota bacterium]